MPLGGGRIGVDSIVHSLEQVADSHGAHPEKRSGVRTVWRFVERGFYFQDLLSVLLNGEIKEQPEYDEA